MIVVGQASAAATSIAIPAHQIGDIIIMFTRRASSTPAGIPSSGPTVPIWTTILSAGANTLAMTAAYTVATQTNHTSGTWGTADQICCIVLRADSGKVITVGVSSTGNGNNTQTIVYPALTLTTLDGSSFGVRVGTRATAVTAVGTPPTNWTNRIIQPAGASALISVHTRAALVANPVADTVTVTSSNAAYRAYTIEVREQLAAQTQAVSGVGSAAAFGSKSVSVGPPPAPQTVVVSGVPPSTYDLHIASEYLAGQALVGWTGGAQFGTPVVQVTTAVITPIGGVASAQAFGTPTIRAVIRPTLGGVSSAQAFGAPTIKTFAVPLLTGISSAQAFGTPTIRTAIIRPVSGLGSAQAFGSIKTALTRPVVGLASAQAFGVPTLKQVTFRLVNGVGSAQAFGAVTLYAIRRVTLVGLPSAQGFGTPVVKITVGTDQIVQVQGILPWKPHLSGMYLAGQAVVGGSGVDPFGTPRFLARFAVLGLGSAQAFGHPGIYKRIGVLGVGSAQEFGIPLVRRSYLLPSPPWEVPLVPTTAPSVILGAAVCVDLTLSPNVCVEVSATPSVPAEIVLEPAEVN